MQRTALVTALLLVALVTPVGATTQEQVTLTVSVVTKTGDPVGGATVVATWDGGSREVETASNGKAFVDVPGGARVELDVEDETYIRNFPYVVESADDGEEVTVEVAPKGSVTIETNGTDGPVSDARVVVRRDGREVASGTTDADGEYDSPAIEQGTYTVVTSKPGYYRNETTVTVTGSVRETVEMRQGSVTATFTVVDDHFDPPKRLDNASVSVGDRGTVRTTNGRATFTVPVNSRIAVTATKPGYRTAEKTLAVGESPTDLTLAIRREATLDVRTANARVVAGETVLVSVVNAYGTEVADATVTVDGTAVGTTDGNGELRVTIPSEGQHEIRATKGGVTSEAVIVEGVAASEKTATPTPTPSPTTVPATDSPTPTTNVPLPGFTALAALAALVAALGVAALRP